MNKIAPPDFLSRLAACARGGTATLFALLFPAFALLACGAVDLVGVNSDRSAMQDAADAAALAMAKQLGVATAAGISARAQDFADAQLGPVVARDAAQVSATVSPDNTSVTVDITGHRSSFFGDLLPPGGWTMTAQATASTIGELPLCVLGTASGGAGDIALQGYSQMTANKCLVQSNGDLDVSVTGQLSAAMAQASGTASGPISPSPQTGAPPISDPFASIDFNPPLLGLCNPLDLVFSVGVNVLTPGTHCGNITVRQGATVQMLPGVYYFAKGSLSMLGNSRLIGSNVVLIFNDDASFDFKDSSSIDLSGRRSGTFAGIVIATTRTNTNTFTISSDSARTLEGAIYIPDATLEVTGHGNRVADQSAWTVVVAKGLTLQGSPDLVINANYAGSNVPAPQGVGDKYSTGEVALSK